MEVVVENDGMDMMCNRDKEASWVGPVPDLVGEVGRGTCMAARTLQEDRGTGKPRMLLEGVHKERRTKKKVR